MYKISDGVRPEDHLTPHRMVPYDISTYHPDERKYISRIFLNKKDAKEFKDKIDSEYNYALIKERRDGKFEVQIYSSIEIQYFKKIFSKKINEITRKIILAYLKKKSDMPWISDISTMPFGTWGPDTSPYQSDHPINYDFSPFDNDLGFMWDPYTGYPIIRPETSYPKIIVLKDENEAKNMMNEMNKNPFLRVDMKKFKDKNDMIKFKIIIT